MENKSPAERLSLNHCSRGGLTADLWLSAGRPVDQTCGEQTNQNVSFYFYHTVVLFTVYGREVVWIMVCSIFSLEKTRIVQTRFVKWRTHTVQAFPTPPPKKKASIGSLLDSTSRFVSIQSLSTKQCWNRNDTLLSKHSPEGSYIHTIVIL